MAPTVGVNLRVTGHCNQGGRKYMEDCFVVAYQQTEDEKDLEYAYFGIFDGHGGREAALFAKEHLMDHIVDQKNFWSEDDDLVLKAIRDGFITTHMAMWKEVGKWPKTVSGLPSTSGTTSSVAFIRHGKMYIGHVGDSKIVVGYQDPGSKEWQPLSLTKDHKPESPKEKKRIYSVGGLVMNKAGVERVVWNRPRLGHKGPIRRSTHFDQIPFLAVARSLGDLWSYNYLRREFVVSPEPDVSVFPLDPKRDRCVILASDGLWNMVSTRDAVRLVQLTEEENEHLILEGGGPNGVGKPINNPSKRLVDRALSLWYELRMRADNTSVVTVLVDPPGPPKSEVLLRQKVMQKLRPREDQTETEIQSVQNESDNGESRGMKKAGCEVGSGKVSEEMVLAAKERKKQPSPELRYSILPRPVVLCPQRMRVRHARSRNDLKTCGPANFYNNNESLNRSQRVLKSGNSNRSPLSVRTKPFYPEIKAEIKAEVKEEVKEEVATCSAESVSNENTTPLSSCSNTEDKESICRKESLPVFKRVVITVVEGDRYSENSVGSALVKEEKPDASSLDILHSAAEGNFIKSEPVYCAGENRTFGKSDVLKKLLLDGKTMAGNKRKHSDDGTLPDTSPLKSARIQQTGSLSAGQFSSCRSTASQDSNLPHNTRAQQRVRKMKV